MIHNGFLEIYKKREKELLSKGSRSEHFSDKIEGLVININPGCVEFDNRSMVKGTEKVNFRIKAL